MPLGWNRIHLLLASVAILFVSTIHTKDLRAEPAFTPSLKDAPRGPVASPFPYRSFADIQAENRVHDVGNIRVNVANWGYIGNKQPNLDGNMLDPCTGDWAPQFEYPSGSGVQYLWQSGVWIGAVIREEAFEYPRVSEGVSPTTFETEMYPGPPPGNGIVERSTRANAFNCLGDFVSDPLAVSEQDFYAVYSDTHRVRPGGSTIDNPTDGQHIPLGIKVTQRSYAWSYNYASDFILIDYEIENIADKYLKNVYVGLYVDGDVGSINEATRYNDDLCGFIRNFTYRPEGSQDSVNLTINSAWIADNDGRAVGVSSGSNFDSPDVVGARVVRAPNPKLRTSFNWWVTGSSNELDYGPAWVDDHSRGDWTRDQGTPYGDERRYFLLSNREFDFDQVYVDEPAYIRNNPQRFVDRFTGEVQEEHEWRPTTLPNPISVASGFDTRYLLSWGPLGVFDYIDEAGERVYRLNPGERFSMTVAFVGGRNFHDRNNFQSSNTLIDPTKYNYLDFQVNADWAAKVYDNPMIDTNGDTWFGEDAGLDGLFGLIPGDSISFTSYDGTLVEAIYPGADEGEGDGILQQEEDEAPRPQKYDYTVLNNLLDAGDGEPDFQGPPPPPSPQIRFRTEGNVLYLQWSPFPSEDSTYTDPFSHLNDFEGYRIYVSNSGLETEYSFLAEFDKVNFAYFSDDDSLMTVPVGPEVIPGLSPFVIHETPDGEEIQGFLAPVGNNIGMDDITVSDSLYEYRVGAVNALIPRYYAITAYDYGDPRSGIEPLESAKAISSTFIAPSGNPDRKPGVVPNPYRGDQNYTQHFLPLTFNNIDTSFVSWENRDDGTPEFYGQTDRRIYFYNLPAKCMIRIFTVSGDLVQMIQHDSGVRTSRLSQWNAAHAEPWNLNNRNSQQVSSGLYLFSVEDLTPGNRGDINVGKFVIIR